MVAATHRVVQSRITGKLKSGDRQLVFTRGRGPYVWDQDENQYVDFVLGYGPVILGHADQSFNARLSDHLSNGLMMPGYTTQHEEYLTRLLEPKPSHRGAPFKTASEAVTAAFRLAALRTGTTGVVRSGYVGWHDAQIANTPKWHEPLRSPHRQRLRHTEGMRGVGPTEPALNWIDLRPDSLARLLEEHEGKIGCFIFDAYLASFVTPKIVLEAFELARAAGCLTVLDETKTGGRISRLGYGHDHGIDADLVVIGKSLANGAPLSLLVGDDELLGAAERARLSGTFSKEMFAIYSALATLDVMESEVGESPDGWQETGRIGQRIASEVTEASTEAGVNDLVWAQPVLGGAMFELAYADEILADKDRRSALLGALTACGVLMLEGHPSFVCLAHRELSWDELRGRFQQAFETWAAVDEGYGGDHE